MNLRITETLDEMFKEPRIFGVFMFVVLPTMAFMLRPDANFQGVCIVASILFVFCFLLVRFSL